MFNFFFSLFYIILIIFLIYVVSCCLKCRVGVLVLIGRIVLVVGERKFWLINGEDFLVFRVYIY